MLRIVCVAYSAVLRSVEDETTKHTTPPINGSKDLI